jgi:hypothetical protein
MLRNILSWRPLQADDNRIDICFIFFLNYFLPDKDLHDMLAKNVDDFIQ